MTSFWDSAPRPIEVDLTQLSDEQRAQFFAEHLSEEQAAEIIAAIEASASDFADKMQRIAKIVDIVEKGLTGATIVLKKVVTGGLA